MTVTTSNRDGSLQARAPSAGDPDVIVVGAGIVGLCIAWQLARRGAAVRLFDPNPPGSGCSSGNAGAFSPGSIVPLASPRTIRAAPGMSRCIATFPNQLWVMPMLPSSGKSLASSVLRCTVGANGSPSVVPSRPPNRIRDPSGDGR